MEAWVTRPERPKGVKDEVKQARRAASQKSGPGGALDFQYQINMALSTWKNKLAKLGDAVAISNLKLSITDPLTHSLTD